jgi:hypothetical protein
MTSVCYVHTHRFVQELLGFAQNFNQLQDLMGQVRAAAENRKVCSDYCIQNLNYRLDNI